MKTKIQYGKFYQVIFEVKLKTNFLPNQDNGVKSPCLSSTCHHATSFPGRSNRFGDRQKKIASDTACPQNKNK